MSLYDPHRPSRFEVVLDQLSEKTESSQEQWVAALFALDEGETIETVNHSSAVRLIAYGSTRAQAAERLHEKLRKVMGTVQMALQSAFDAVTREGRS